jgi:hypothetical protein
LSGVNTIPGRLSPAVSSSGTKNGHARQASITDVEAHERRLRRQAGNRFHYESGFQPTVQPETIHDHDDDDHVDAHVDVDVDVEDLSLDSPKTPGYSEKSQIGGQISHDSSSFGLDQMAVEFAASRNSDNNTSAPELPHSNYLDSVDFVNACKSDLCPFAVCASVKTPRIIALTYFIGPLLLPTCGTYARAVSQISWTTQDTRPQPGQANQKKIYRLF